jgi:hypothetical protein
MDYASSATPAPRTPINRPDCTKRAPAPLVDVEDEEAAADVLDEVALARVVEALAVDVG